MGWWMCGEVRGVAAGGWVGWVRWRCADRWSRRRVWRYRNVGWVKHWVATGALQWVLPSSHCLWRLRRIDGCVLD